MDNETKELMNSGKLYDPSGKDGKLMIEQWKYLRKMDKFNNMKSGVFTFLRRNKMLKKMCAEVGEGCYFEAPSHSSWGFAHCHFGSHVYANFNFTCVDDTDIYIGDYVFFGPNVTLVTAAHPIDGATRQSGIQYNKPIHIGNNCWICSNVTILPGVKVGNNVVIGAGSLVNKDIPDNVVAVGNPCHVLRKITEEDKKYYDHDKLIPEEYKVK